MCLQLNLKNYNSFKVLDLELIKRNKLCLYVHSPALLLIAFIRQPPGGTVGVNWDIFFPFVYLLESEDK